MIRRLAVVVFLCSLLVASCESASSRSSVSALLRVPFGQRVEGTPPLSSQEQAGPSVASVTLLGARVWPGQQDKPLSGTLAQGSTGVSLFLDGDVAHYILPAGPDDVSAKGLPTFSALLSFAPQLSAGDKTLLVQATDQSGRYGPPSHVRLFAEEYPLPQGAVVVALRWRRGADLDLHVTQPDGQEIWSRRKSGSVSRSPGLPSGTGPVGYLDQDSNSLCVRDGQQREHVVYPQRPAPGLYRVLVDTFSLCGEAIAYWDVEARVDGEVIARASGQSLPSDTRGMHGQGSGTVALELELR